MNDNDASRRIKVKDFDTFESVAGWLFMYSAMMKITTCCGKEKYNMMILVIHTADQKIMIVGKDCVQVVFSPNTIRYISLTTKT